MITADDIKLLVASGGGGIQELMKEDNLSEPVFRKDGFFTVILQRPEISSEETTQESSEKSSEKGSEKSRVKILEIVKNKPEITIPEISEIIGITDRNVEKQLAKLKGEGKIQRVGSDKSGLWIITTNGDSKLE